MKFKLLALLPLFALAGCAASQSQHPLSRHMVRHGLDPEYFQIQDKDAEMSRAVREARKNVGVFIAAVKNPTANQHDFEVKKPFVQGTNVEHIWLSKVTFSGNRFHGYVDNKPETIKGLKLGARVSVNPDEISDWAFVDNGKLKGGYTIRVLCSECNSDRKIKMEKDGNFRIEDR